VGCRIFACRTPAEGPPEVFEPGVDELPALRAEGVTLWVSLDEGDESAVGLLTDVFALHELLIEDALTVAPTPKAEVHDDYLYLIVHGLAADLEHEVRTVDVDFFLGDRFLLTHHREVLPSLERVRADVMRNPKLLKKGPVYLMHHLMDVMVDRFLPLMERLDKEVVAIEERVVSDPDPKLLQRIFELKHTLQKLHRVGLHQRVILERLANAGYPRIPKKARPFFRDVLDHFVRVMDLNESYRELVSSSMDAYLSMQSHRLNEVMKILTVISTVMLPLTFVTGLYGMNFDRMPLIHWRYGYEFAWAIMIAFAVGSYVFMKRRGWL